MKAAGARAARVESGAAGGLRADSRRHPAHEFRTFLLHGVTGSGKTEVYLNAIEAVLAEGRSALLLVPEIALTPAMAGQFFSRFGDRVAILHSAFTDVERTDQWRRIRSGAASVVVGTRSGVFAPMRNLGLIVVDEEHDGSYKQEETPRSVTLVVKPGEQASSTNLASKPAAAPTGASGSSTDRDPGKRRQTPASEPQGAKRETRVYKGATYVKEVDGKWHLEK